MKKIRSVLFIIDADNPESILETIIEDGAAAQGYTFETYQPGDNADGYYKLIKE